MANKPIHDNDFYQPKTPLISVEVNSEFPLP